MSGAQKFAKCLSNQPKQYSGDYRKDNAEFNGKVPTKDAGWKIDNQSSSYQTTSGLHGRQADPLARNHFAQATGPQNPGHAPDAAEQPTDGHFTRGRTFSNANASSADFSASHTPGLPPRSVILLLFPDVLQCSGVILN